MRLVLVEADPIIDNYGGTDSGGYVWNGGLGSPWPRSLSFSALRASAMIESHNESDESFEADASDTDWEDWNSPQLGHLYAVQFNVIPLADSPFSLEGRVRPTYKSIFANKECFRHGIVNSMARDWGESPPFSMPFVPHLGAFEFTKKCFRNANLKARRSVKWILSEGHRTTYHPGEYFGFDARLDDQRFNHLSFQLSRPLSLQAKTEGRLLCKAKLFAHLFPSGYLSLVLACSFPGPIPNFTFEGVLREISPWRTDTRWNWNSRLREGTLQSIATAAENAICESILSDQLSDAQRSTRWQTAICTESHTDAENWGDFFTHEASTMRLSWSSWSNYITASRRSLLVNCEPQVRERHRVYFSGGPEDYEEEDESYRPRHGQERLHFFWKIASLYEFVLLKEQVYRDYTAYLSEAERRLSKGVSDSNFDLQLPAEHHIQIGSYLAVLDRHTLPLAPFYRKIYSTIADGRSLDTYRSKVMSALRLYEKKYERVNQTTSPSLAVVSNWYLSHYGLSPHDRLASFRLAWKVIRHVTSFPEQGWPRPVKTHEQQLLLEEIRELVAALSCEVGIIDDDDDDDNWNGGVHISANEAIRRLRSRFGAYSDVIDLAVYAAVYVAVAESLSPELNVDRIFYGTGIDPPLGDTLGDIPLESSKMALYRAAMRTGISVGRVDEVMTDEASGCEWNMLDRLEESVRLATNIGDNVGETNTNVYFAMKGSQVVTENTNIRASEGSIVNFKSKLENVNQWAASLQENESEHLRLFAQSVKDLAELIAQLPSEKSDEATLISSRLEECKEAVTKSAKPGVIRMSADGLVAAAKSVANVIPAVLDAANKVAEFALKLF